MAARKAIGTGTSPLHEPWYYCLPCERVWSARTWQSSGWACPSSLQHAWPDFHPHIGWSHLHADLGGVTPTEGSWHALPHGPTSRRTAAATPAA